MTVSTNFFQYRDELRYQLAMRFAGDEVAEERSMDRLDALWNAMSDDERAVANTFAHYLSEQCLDEAGRVVRAPCVIDEDRSSTSAAQAFVYAVKSVNTSRPASNNRLRLVAA